MVKEEELGEKRMVSEWLRIIRPVGCRHGRMCTGSGSVAVGSVSVSG